MSESQEHSSTPKRRAKKYAGDASSSSAPSPTPSSERRVEHGPVVVGRSPEAILKVVIGYTVAVMWVIGLGVDMANISPSWDFPAYVHIIFSGVVSSMYISSAIVKSRNGNGE